MMKKVTFKQPKLEARISEAKFSVSGTEGNSSANVANSEIKVNVATSSKVASVHTTVHVADVTPVKLSTNNADNTISVILEGMQSLSKVYVENGTFIDDIIRLRELLALTTTRAVLENAVFSDEFGIDMRSTREDIAVLSESITMVASYDRQLVDSLALSESVELALSCLRDYYETVVVSDNASIGTTKVFVDTNTLTEAFTYLIGRISSFVDTAVYTESYIRNVSTVCRDTVRSTETVLKAMTFGRSFNDLFTASESSETKVSRPILETLKSEESILCGYQDYCSTDCIAFGYVAKQILIK